VAVTQRDDFLLELGEALAGHASVRPVDSVAAACELLKTSRRGQVLVIDTRDHSLLQIDLQRAAQDAPHAVVVLFATAEDESGVTAAVTGLEVHSILALPIDNRKAALALESAFADATARKPTRSTTTILSAAMDIPPEFKALKDDGEPRSRVRLIALVGGALALVAGGIWWWRLPHTPPPVRAPAAEAAAPATPVAADNAAPASGDTTPLVPQQLVETSIVKGKVDELLEKGRLALRERRFTEPAGDNALLYYRSAAAADADNGEAKDGLQRVAGVLFGRFETAMNGTRLDEAALALANLKLATPQDARIAQLEIRVASAQISKAVAEGNLERANALMRQAQQSGVSQDQLAKWRADIARRQDDTKVVRLAGLVASSIREGRLMDPPEDNARAYLQQLQEAAPQSAMTARAVRDLNAAFLRRAREAKNPAEADRWLSEFRNGGGSAAEIEALRRDLSSSRQKATQAETDRVLGLFHDRLRDGKLTDPPQDSAAFYLSQLQSADPANAALNQANHDIAAKLVERARGAISGGKIALADADIAQAKRYGADAKDIASLQQLEAGRGVTPTPIPAAARAQVPAPIPPAPSTASSEAGGAAPVTGEPKLIRKVQPDFPPKALDKNLSGSVTVQFVVDVNGVPRDVRVIEATPPGIFDHAAIEAVKRWRYQPTLANGKPVEVPVQIPIRFAQPE
jgi:protein TonB